MDIFQKAQTILREPGRFFEKLKEKGLGEAFIYLAAIMLFSAVMSAIVYYYVGSMVDDAVSSLAGMEASQERMTGTELAIYTPLSWVATLLLSFLSAGILHAWILIFGGTSGYKRTYQLMAYSSTPSYIFGWIPFVAIFIWIYSLVLLVIGTEKMHKIPRTKAILMYAVPAGIITAIILAGWITLIYAGPHMPFESAMEFP